MDWSRTKTIFIITFMLLNIFLAYQLYEKQNMSRMSEMALPELESRIEEQQIEVEIDDAEEEVTGGPITGMQRTFQEASLEQSLAGQDVSLVNDATIFSELEEPYSIVTANVEASLEGFLEQYVFRGEEYRVAHYDPEEGIIGLYQTFEGSMIDQYEREDYHLVLQLNEDDEIAAYSQRYMTITERAEEEELLTPLQAVELLLDDPNIGIGTEAVVESAQLGYYNLMEVDANFQIFAPVWRVMINGETYYVNAMTGEIQTIS
jgi:regulatory protein YycI of two-component signal transduction system YycFG